jgi:hypothetical protein
MTDRAILFLSSLVLFLGGIAVCVWLIATGQLGSFDGNFLLLSSMLITTAFGLYIRSLIRGAIQVRPAPPAKKADVRSPAQAGQAAPPAEAVGAK